MSALERTIEWESRTIRLSYQPRYCGVIDFVEIDSNDGEALPITRTGYLSHFFGPVEPQLTIDEVTVMVVRWLDAEARSNEWLAYIEQSKQLSLF